MYPFECGKNWLGGGLPPPDLADLDSGDVDAPCSAAPFASRWCWAAWNPAPSWTWYLPPPPPAGTAMGPPRGMTMPPPPRSVEGTQRGSPPPSPCRWSLPDGGDGASPSSDEPLLDWDDWLPTRDMDRKDRAPAMEDDSAVDDVDSDAFSVPDDDEEPGREAWRTTGGL